MATELENVLGGCGRITPVRLLGDLCNCKGTYDLHSTFRVLDLELHTLER
jgi:hypothetical protein